MGAHKERNKKQREPRRSEKKLIKQGLQRRTGGGVLVLLMKLFEIDVKRDDDLPVVVGAFVCVCSFFARRQKIYLEKRREEEINGNNNDKKNPRGEM